MLAVVALALIGFAIASWLAPMMAVDAALPAIAVSGAHEPASAAMSGPAAALLTALLCLAAALILVLRARRSGAAGLHGPLSGLYGAHEAAEVLADLLARDDRGGRSRLALVQIGVDAIEDIRERHGAAAVGDVLDTIGRHIRSQTRGVDLPTVAEGHGFAVFLRATEVEQAGAFCRRLATLLRSDQLEWRGEVIKVSASMGIVLREIGEPLDALQHRARQKLAEARTAGGGRIAF